MLINNTPISLRQCIILDRSICDSDGPKIADAFYGHLSSLSMSVGSDAPVALDIMHAAYALHVAVTKLHQERNCSVRHYPSRISVHVGAFLILPNLAAGLLGLFSSFCQSMKWL